MKILVCFGTRPEAIKMAPLVHALQKSFMEVLVVVTAQHRDMLDQVLEFFEITPDVDLNLMLPNQSLNALSGKIFIQIDSCLIQYKPDLVLVHGDTTTSVMVALAAFHRQIPVGHVEAGLRTFDIRNPFPEEMNRQMTSKLATYHFAPTQQAKENLLQEGVSENQILLCGNTIVDALFFGKQKIEQGFENVSLQVAKQCLETFSKMVLITCHRRESFGDGIQQIALAIKALAAKHSNTLFWYPLHQNPKVKEPMQQILGGISNVYLSEPMDYPSFLFLMSQADLILTDSGGIQEEAPSFGKMVLVMRDTTERPEAIAAGTAKLVGTQSTDIVQAVDAFLQYPNNQLVSNPFGDGTASQQIVSFIQNQICHA